MKIAAIVRARDWWSYKIPPLLGAAYVLVLVLDLPFATGATALGLLAVFLLATASFGYFLNDLCDIEADRAAGKPNAAAKLSLSARIGVLAGLAAAMALPWGWLPRHPATLTLVAIEVALLVIYAAPPIRLKERGAAALVTDALYAHTVPLLLVLTTVGALSPAPGRYALGPVPEWVGGLLIAWSFLVGFRGILLHQVDDYLADRRAGTKTAITPRTRILAVSFIIMVCLPAEIGLVVALIVSLSSAVSYFAAYAGVSFTLLGIRAAREAVRRRRDDPSLADWRLDDDLGVGAWLESSPGGGLAVRTGRERTGEAWMLRLRTRAVVIPPGQPHRLYLRARSDRRRPFELAVTETREPWTRLGPYESRELDTEWGRVRIDLPATDQSVEVCAQLNLGTGVGPVELTDVALVRVGDSANLLEDDQALAPDPYDRARAYRRRRFADYIGAWVLNDFYEKWLPLFPLVALTVREPWYAVVAGAHLILFRSALPRP